ncbi:MAG: trypsin-like serine protease [Bacteriovoracaceae bacterium]|jgi:V8-like Glu-specific endopeptidase|nr:trypsin-like serine protease [Bacteriovoracaceae bacterium]
MIKLILITTILSTTIFSQEKTICGETDDRIRAYNMKIGRLSTGDKHKGCTVTMISESCGITAGHCEKVLDYAEFNPPLSTKTGMPRAAALEDKYYIDKDSIDMQYNGLGMDWAIVKFKPNEMTGKLPGQINGYYDVSFEGIKRGSEVIITGYGLDQDDPEKNFTLQTHKGKVSSVGFWNKVLKYSVDTMGGNSGSSIIDAKTGKIVGIHTNGGCTSSSGKNQGVAIKYNRKLQAAIKKCLARR